MIKRINLTVLKFLKSFILFSIMFLIASLTAVVVEEIELKAGALAIIVMQILLLSLPCLVKNNSLKKLIKLIAVIIGLALFIYIVFENYALALIGKKSIDFDFADVLPRLIYLAFYLVSLFATVRDTEWAYVDSVYTHRRAVSSFKKLLVVLSIVLLLIYIVSFIIQQVNGGTLFEDFLTASLLPVILIVLSNLVNVRVARDFVYIEVKNVATKGMLVGYAVFGGSAVGITTFLIIFRNKLNEWWKAITAALGSVIDTVIRLGENLLDYFEKLGPTLEVPLTNEQIQDIIDDFGIDPDKLPLGEGGIQLPNANRPEGDLPNLDLGGELGELPSLGGIGAISGVGGSGSSGSGSLGGQNGSDLIFNNAGEILGVIVSESGSFGAGEGGGGSNSAAVVMIKSNAKTEYTYLKLKSFGAYNGQGFDEATPYTQNINGYGMNYQTGLTLESKGKKQITLEIKSLTGQYFLPDYIAPTNKFFSSNDVMYEGIAYTPYSVDCYDMYNDVFSFERVYTGNDAKALDDYYSYVTDEYTKLPESTRIQAINFLNDNQLNNDWYSSVDSKIEKIHLFFSKYTYSLDYDKTLDAQSDVVMSFLQGYSNNKGICQHFAGAEVVLLRALGVPARYVGGLHVGILDADTWHVVTANAAHAWVEVYIKNKGWIRLDPTKNAMQSETRYDHVYDDKGYTALINQWKNWLSTGELPGGGSGTGGSGTGGSGTGGSGTGGNGGSGTEGGGNQNGGDDTGDTGGTGSDGDTGSETPGGSGDVELPGGGDNNETEDDGKDEGGEGDSEGEWELPNLGELDNENQDLNQATATEEKDFPWETVGIVACSAVAAALIVTVVVMLIKRRRPKATSQKVKEEKNSLKAERKPQELITEEEDKTAKQIIRENYKEFISFAGKNGIRKVRSDTTESLRNKYNALISPDEAMEILTGLYRHARYNKNEKLCMADAEVSQNCLKIIRDSIKNKLKEI